MFQCFVKTRHFAKHFKMRATLGPLNFIKLKDSSELDFAYVQVSDLIYLARRSKIPKKCSSIFNLFNNMTISAKYYDISKMSTLFLNISYLHLLIIDTLWVFSVFQYQLSIKTSLKYLKSSYSSNILQYFPHNNIVINCNCMKGSLHCLTQQTFILYHIYFIMDVLLKIHYYPK